VLLSSALVVSAVMAGAGEDAPMKRIEERELVRTVTLTFAVYQAGEKIGTEEVTRSDYNDNTVQFRSDVAVVYPQGVEMTIGTDLLLEEESFFPMKYHAVKNMKQSGVDIDMGSDIDWYANVAVFRRSSESGVDTSRVVLPVGTAVMDQNVAHHLYVPLYWYDSEAGGVQGFNVVDPMNQMMASSSLRLQVEDEAVAVAGHDVIADRYEFVRNKQTFKLYVDAEGRIVKVDQGYLVFEMTDWSESVVQDQ